MCVSVLKAEKSSADEDIKRVLCRQRDHLEKTVGGMKARMAKAAEEHEKVYVKIMKVKRGVESYSCEFE